ncbi:MAG: cupin domain-containing protein [Eubacterium sp.]
MIKFTWNGVVFDITDMGGGSLGDDIPRHSHAKNSYELHFITGGKGELVTDTKSYELKAGDFFITGPNIYHAQSANKKDPVKDVFIMLQVINSDKANAVSSTFLDTHFYFCENFKNDVAVEILYEYRNKKTDYKSAVSGLSVKLLTDITRFLLPPSFSEVLAGESLNDRRFVIIEQAFLYNPSLTLTELSGKIGVCERQTERLLKRYYGKTFREKKAESRQKGIIY